MRVSITRRDVFWTAAALALPILVMTLYLVIAVPNYWNGGAGDFAALIVALAAGISCVRVVPLLKDWKVTACASYAVAMAGVLLVYTLTFVCAVFQECL